MAETGITHKLNESQKNKLIKDYLYGMSRNKCAEKYKISTAQASNIIKGLQEVRQKINHLSERKIMVNQELIKIENEKSTTLSEEHQKVVDDIVSKKMVHFDMVMNSLIATHNLADMITNEVQDEIKNSKNKKELLPCVSELSKLYVRHFSSLFDARSVKLNNTNVNQKSEVIYANIPNGRITKE